MALQGTQFKATLAETVTGLRFLGRVGDCALALQAHMLRRQQVVL